GGLARGACRRLLTKSGTQTRFALREFLTQLRDGRLPRLLTLENGQMAALEIGRIELGDVWLDDYVRPAQFLAGDRVAHDGESLKENVEGAFDGPQGGLGRDVGGDHDIGPQAPRDLDRHWAHYPPIHIVAAIDAHRSEHTGHRTRRAHRHTR